MKKVVINRCFGGFGLSKAAVMRYAELKGFTLYHEKSSICDHYYRVPVKEYHNIEQQVKDSGDYSLIDGLYFSEREIERDDPLLVQVVEELGKKSWGWAAELTVVEIPEDVDWHIVDYDGREHIAETHRTWY